MKGHETKMDLKCIWPRGVEWIDLAEVRNMVMNLEVSQKAEDFWTSLATAGFSRRTVLKVTSELQTETALVRC
jgi:hypothetical protein